MSRTEKSLKNIKFALLFQAGSILVAFFTRKVFVLILSEEYLGLDGTFSNILTMLSLAELGIGNAITYSLYKPLAEGNRVQIVSLMRLYRRVYWTIGGVVALLGCALAPFLGVLVKELPAIPHIHLIYLLFVLNTALSYFYMYKQALIIADQRQYITTTCHYGLKMLLFLAQALFLWLTHNYFVYLGLQIATTLFENLLLTHEANRLYPYLHHVRPQPLDREVRRGILQNTKAMIAHKVGGIVVFGTDNLLISFFTGVVSVGRYSNYLMVTNGLNSVYGLLFRSLTASVGNLHAVEDARRAWPVFKRVDFVGHWLYGFSTICLVVLFNPFITLWVGEDYLFSQTLVGIIAANFYVTGMRKAVLTFRDAYGLYWPDRYKPIFESIINLVVSAILAVPFGVAGILIGTFVSTMTTCFWVEPYVLFKHGLKAPLAPYFLRYGINTLITLLGCGMVGWVCSLLPGSGLLLFLEKMAVCAILGNLIFLLAYHRTESFRDLCRLGMGFLRKLLKWRTNL